MPHILSQTITSNQLLNLKSTPVKVVDATGSGYVNVPFLVFMRLNAGSNSYGTLSTSLCLTMNGVDIFPNQHMSTAFLGSSSDKFVYYIFTNSNIAPGINVSDGDNKDIYIKNPGLLELSSGNGTLDFQIQWNAFTV